MTQSTTSLLATSDSPVTMASSVLRKFLPDVDGVELTAIDEGFSGGQVWRVTTATKAWALRRSPAAMAWDRIAWIHDIQRRFDAEWLPTPVCRPTGSSLVESHGHCWELARWLPGSALTRSAMVPSAVIAGAETLARWHRLADSLRLPAPTWDQPPAVRRRREEQQRLQSWIDQVDERQWPTALQAEAHTAIGLLRVHQANQQQWLRDLDIPGPAVLCHGDSHREHQLFVDGAVTGLIDWGTLRWDVPIVDLARWLGSVAPTDDNLGRQCLAAYDRISPTPQGNRLELYRLLDLTGSYIALARWTQWSLQPGFSPRGLLRWRELLDRVRQW